MWALAAVLFSALTVGTCEFLSIPFSNLPEAEDDGTYTPTGKIGLFTIQEVDSTGYERCTEMPGYLYDSFSTFFQVAQLMGVVALTAGAVAAILLVLTFFMQMCCAVTGLQYGLGIIFLIACCTQGLTFMSIGDGACASFECAISMSSIWSIVAIVLYFIAMVQSFAAPFPTEKLCSKQACCKCCQKKEKEVHEEEKDVEAQEAAPKAAPEPVDDNAAAAAAAAGVAGGAAAGAGVAVAVAADDDEEEQKEEDKLDNEEDAAAAAASTTGNDKDAVDMTVLDEDQKALDEEAAAAASSSADDVFKSATSVGVGDIGDSDAKQE